VSAFDEYQEAAARTINGALDDRERLMDAASGMAEESGGEEGKERGRKPCRGVAPGDPGGDLVERAVAAEADDHVEAAARRVVGEAGGVAAPIGLDEFDVVAAAQPTMDHHRVACGHRRGERVDHEQDSQGFGRYPARGVVTGTRHTDRRSGDWEPSGAPGNFDAL